MAKGKVLGVKRRIREGKALQLVFVRERGRMKNEKKRLSPGVGDLIAILLRVRQKRKVTTTAGERSKEVNTIQ